MMMNTSFLGSFPKGAVVPSRVSGMRQVSGPAFSSLPPQFGRQSDAGAEAAVQLPGLGSVMRNFFFLPVLAGLGLVAVDEAKADNRVPRYFEQVQVGDPSTSAKAVAALNEGLTVQPPTDPLAGLSINDVIDRACRMDAQNLNIPRISSLTNLNANDISAINNLVSSSLAGFLQQNTVKILTFDSDGDAGIGSGWRCTDPSDPTRDFIVTNQHVVGSNKQVFVVDSRGNQVSGQVVGASAASGEDDLALVRVSAADMATLSMRSIPIARTDEVAIGLPVSSGGYPYGIGFTNTRGVVSNTSTSVPGSFTEMLQSDEAVNPGNSGGPKVALFPGPDGPVVKLVGMNTEIFSPTGAFSGISLAKPSHSIAPVLTLIRNGVNPKRGTMGIESANGSSIMGELVDTLIQLNASVAQDKAALAEIQQAITAMNAGKPQDIPEDIADFFMFYGIDPSDPTEKDDILGFLNQAKQYYQSDLDQMNGLVQQVQGQKDYYSQNPPDPNAVYIIYVVPDSYADQAGVKPGDKLLAINGTSVDDIDNEDRVIGSLDFEYKFRIGGFPLRVQRGATILEGAIPGQLQPVGGSNGQAGASSNGSCSSGLALSWMVPGSKC